MAVYLITYDLNREIVRPNITKAIKSYPLWAKLSESSYAISTPLTVKAVYDKLKPLLDSDDNLYVMTLRRPYTGFGPNEVNEWLDEHLPNAFA